MNPWYVLIIELFVFTALVICFIVFLVLLITAKKKKKPTVFKSVLLSLDVILLACSAIFALSHPTWYKFNDWSVMNADIDSVISRYGSFDIGEAEEGKQGKAGYYIYTDDGPVMPDHMKHYYWVYFDENGTVYRVGDEASAGG